MEVEGEAASLMEALRRLLRRRLRPAGAGVLDAPGVIERSVLRRCGYLDAFPNQLIGARSPARYLTPAACLHLYPHLAGGRLPQDPVVTLVQARCGRFEGGSWSFPFRLSAFEMIEVVVLGTPASASRARDRLESRLRRVLGGLGIPGVMEPATDAFFAGGSRAAQMYQTLRDSKREYRAGVGKRSVALASVNRHHDHFTQRFRIAAKNGGIAHSACLAVGLERLTAWCLLTWGADPSGWPPAVRP